jgi:hypothetical protein
MTPGDLVPEVIEGRSSVRDSSSNNNDTGSAEADKLWPINQTQSVIDICCPKEIPLPVVQTSEQTPTSATPSTLDLPNLGDETPVAIDIFNFTIKKVID